MGAIYWRAYAHFCFAIPLRTNGALLNCHASMTAVKLGVGFLGTAEQVRRARPWVSCNVRRCGHHQVTGNRRHVLAARLKETNCIGSTGFMNKPLISADRYTTSRFSASLLPERDRIAIWREVFGRTNIRLDMETLGDEPFHCESEALSFGDITTLCASFSAFKATRTRELLSDNRHDFSLVMPLKGRAWGGQSGTEVEIGEGEAIVLDTSRTGSVHFSNRSKYLNICVPQAALAPLVPNVEDAAMTIIPTHSEPLRLILGYCQLLRSENAPRSPETVRILSTHFHDLIAAAVNLARNQRPSAESQGIRAARLKALKFDIVRHACSVDVTIDAVARRLSISPRYIRKLLAGENTTFSELVLNERLACAYRVLSDHRHAGRSICDIAFSVGFGDLSYFNRTFRRRFGITPSEVRCGANAH